MSEDEEEGRKEGRRWRRDTGTQLCVCPFEHLRTRHTWTELTHKTHTHTIYMFKNKEHKEERERERELV